MTDNPELIERYENELFHTVERMRRDGIRYDVIIWLLESLLDTIKLMSSVSAWVSMK